MTEKVFDIYGIPPHSEKQLLEESVWPEDLQDELDLPRSLYPGATFKTEERALW